MAKRTKAGILRQINESKDRISKERDVIRDLGDELAEIDQSCSEAVDGLESAAEALSRYL